jgi:hypothetical protein
MGTRAAQAQSVKGLASHEYQVMSIRFLRQKHWHKKPRAIMSKAISAVGVIAIVLFNTAYPSIGAPNSQEIANYQKKMLSHREDLIEIGTNIRGLSQEIAINLSNLAARYSGELAYIQDLLSIQSLVQARADRERILPVINRSIRRVAEGIDLSIREVNLSISHLESQSIIATAVKLREDLRALKEVLRHSQ